MRETSAGTQPRQANWHSMDLEELLPKMRARVAQCRRLAAATTDERTAAILRAMADEGDADIARLLGEASGTSSPKAQPSE